MKSHYLAAQVVGVVALSQPVASWGATGDALRAASRPIMEARVGSSGSLNPFRRVGQAVVTVNNKLVNFQGSSLIRAQGKLLVPLRPIGEALGAQVVHNAATNAVNATRAGYRLTLQDGVYKSQGKTLVPLRTLSESLGVRVAVTNTVGLMRIALTPTHNGRAGVTVISRRNRPAPLPQNSQGKGDDITAAHLQYNLKQLNAIRARAGAPALKLDAGLNEFARQGSLELMRTHVPHGHFSKANVWQNGFEKSAAENQGDPRGWFPGPVNQSIDQILKAMMDEGPGGGHHDNILNPAFRRVGIGLVKDPNGRLYFTNDFSG